jgi:cation diffusion facilitator family transporter
LSDASSQDAAALRLAVAVYVVIFAAKLAAYAMSGVLALLAEALHTLSDIFVSGFLWIAVVYSRRQADSRHPFGYGRAQNVAALVAATLFISFTSLELYREAIPRLVRSDTAAYGNLWLAIAVVVASMAAAAVPLIKLRARRPLGSAARAQMLELVNDQLGLAAALVASLAVAWGYPIVDPLASIAVATLIAWNAVVLLRDNASMLLGRSPAPEFLQRIEAAARSVPGVLGIRDLRAEYVGPDTVHAGMVIELAPQTSVLEADRISDQVRSRVHEQPQAGYCYIQTAARAQ